VSPVPPRLRFPPWSITGITAPRHG